MVLRSLASMGAREKDPCEMIKQLGAVLNSAHNGIV
ncbi:hypothetical protein EDD73_107131, partial [Heliophilum fasciatum]